MLFQLEITPPSFSNHPRYGTSSVANILKSGLDQVPAVAETVMPTPAHGNIRGKTYYQ